MENAQFIKEGDDLSPECVCVRMCVGGEFSAFPVLHAVSFPVPWGHIAGREWGDPTGTPVLALHGEYQVLDC